MVVFRWRIATHGYKWKANDDEEDDFGTGPSFYLEPKIYQFREYLPFEHPELFREFAGLDRTPEGVLEFASKFGHLGTRFADPDEPLEPGEDVETPQQLREWRRQVYLDRCIWDPLEHWDLAIETMHNCVEAWEQIRDKVTKSSDTHDFLSGINEEIVKHLVEVQIEPAQRSPSGFCLTYVPRNLLGAMWVQFAQAIIENKDFRKCRNCEHWFSIAHGENRKSRIYCSDACKSKAYRLRQEQAQKNGGRRKGGRGEC